MSRVNGTPEWPALDPEGRRERAERACREGDVAALWALTAAQLETQVGAISPHTQRSYRRSIERFVAEGSRTNPLQVTAEDAERYVQGLSQTDLSPATIRAHMAGIRALYRALRWAGATEVDPFLDVRLSPGRTGQESRRERYGEAEREALLEMAEAVDRALILLSAEAGLRVSECVALTWPDVDLTQGQLTVRRSKGTQVLALSPALLDVLRALPRDSGARVLGYTSEVWARRRIQQLAERAGVSYRGIEGLRAAASHQIGAHDQEQAEDRAALRRSIEEEPGSGRTSLRTELTRAIAEAQRTQNHFALLLIRLDQVGLIDREYGRQVGDVVRKIAAARIERVRRPYDIIADYDSEHFAVILKGIPSEMVLWSVAQRFSRSIDSHPASVDGRQLATTVEVGAVMGQDDPEGLIRQAEEALRRV